MVISTTAVGARIIARMLSRVGLWWDDYLIMAALVCSLGLECCMIISSTAFDFGKHMNALGDLPTRMYAASSFFKFL